MEDNQFSRHFIRGERGWGRHGFEDFVIYSPKPTGKKYRECPRGVPRKKCEQVWESIDQFFKAMLIHLMGYK